MLSLRLTSNLLLPSLNAACGRSPTVDARTMTPRAKLNHRATPDGESSAVVDGHAGLGVSRQPVGGAPAPPIARQSL